jgi:malonate transporter MadL subunit
VSVRRRQHDKKSGDHLLIVYGVALLSACLLVGMLVGEALGLALGVDANVGGVGIAMVLLVLASNSDRFRSLTAGEAGLGISFWSAMYIPIVVAMAARQNVAGALDGGTLAILAGSAAVVVSFALVPLISAIGRDDSPPTDQPAEDSP